MTDVEAATEADQGIADANHRLISSNRIEGTPVFDRRAEKIGSIHAVMIDKTDGQVAYAVLTFGGFLGFGSRAYPLPWSMLTYARDLHGYCLELTREDIEGAPYMKLDQADRPQLTREPAYRHWDEYL
jgi:sporulation protein YlmC with PRC-barrel domain